MYTQLIPSFLYKHRLVFNYGGEWVTSVSIPFWQTEWPELAFGLLYGEKTYWGKL